MISYNGYIIKPHKQYPTSYTVAVEGQGGKIPNMLNTLFTSVGIAKEHVDKYLDIKLQVKERTNASKAISKSRG